MLAGQDEPERIEKVNVSRGKLQLAVKPWEIVTIALPAGV